MSYKMRDLKTGDIYKMSRILKKLEIKLDNIDKESTIEEVGVNFVQKILENLHLSQDEINEFLADLVGITADEFNELPLGETIKILEKFKDQKDLMPFLKLAGK